MKKIVITGSKGFLGSRLEEFYRETCQVTGASHKRLDIAREDQVAGFLKEEAPDLVIHCAAISDTGASQREPELSRQVNVEGPANVARACRHLGCRLVMMSSDQVYTGSGPSDENLEEAPVAPSNVYGRHKKLAEEMVLSILPEAVCLRLTWLYDLPGKGKKVNGNLPCNVIKALVQNRPLKVPCWEHRGMTYVQEVVENMEKAMELPGGVYNYGSENQMDTYETARSFLRLIAAGRDQVLVKDEERFAGSPRNLAFHTQKAQAQGIRFSNTQEGFARCLEDYATYMEGMFL